MRKKSRDGSTLLFVMIVMLVISIIGVGLLTTASLRTREVTREKQRAEAFCMAERGVNEFRAMVSHHKNFKPFKRLEIGHPRQSSVFAKKQIHEPKGKALGWYKVALTPKTTGFYRYYTLTSVGTSGSQTVTITLTTRQPTVGEYVSASDDERDIPFRAGEIIYGDFRTNGRLIVYPEDGGGPKFVGLVRTAQPNFNLWRWWSDNNYVSDTTGMDDIFTEGVDFNAPPLYFDTEVVTDMKAEAQEIIEGDCSITFKDDGTYVETQQKEVTSNVVVYDYEIWQERRRNDRRVRTVEGDTEYPNVNSPYYIQNLSQRTVETTELAWVSTTNQIANIGDSSTAEDNIIYVDGTVEVTGEVAGSVSIASSGDIRITGDIVYASKKNDPDPLDWWEDQNFPDEGERLGLFAADRVSVEGKGPGVEVFVHAAIYAAKDYGPSVRTQGFYAEQYMNPDYDERNGTKPFITVFGSIVQCTRGSMGYGAIGCAKKQFHDIRFIINPPPGTPADTPLFFDWKVKYTKT